MWICTVHHCEHASNVLPLPICWCWTPLPSPQPNTSLHCTTMDTG